MYFNHVSCVMYMFMRIRICFLISCLFLQLITVFLSKILIHTCLVLYVNTGHIVVFPNCRPFSTQTGFKKKKIIYIFILKMNFKSSLSQISLKRYFHMMLC